MKTNKLAEASTGPRSIERGNFDLEFEAAKKYLKGFNGAALN